MSTLMPPQLIGLTPDIVTLEDVVSANARCWDAPEEHKRYFHPDPSSPVIATLESGLAKGYCRSCPVRAECLELSFLIDAGRWGIWGGTSERERQRMRRERREKRAA